MKRIQLMWLIAFAILGTNFVKAQLNINYGTKQIYSSAGTGSLSIQGLVNQSASDNTIINQYAGNVGIGTTTQPDRKLTVSGNTMIKDIVVSASNPYDGKSTLTIESDQREGIYLKTSHGTNSYRYALNVEANNAYTKAFAVNYNDGTTTTENFRVYANGKGYFASSLSIGTQNNIDAGKVYALSVNGSARVKEIKVYPGWADYVFDDNYNLMPLDSLKSFVNTNNHLPNVPTADEVSKEGVNLGESNAKLLEKIEELTLYVIQLNDELAKVKSQIGNTPKQITNE